MLTSSWIICDINWCLVSLIFSKEFVNGRLAAGEMGNGISLEDIIEKEQKKKEDMYQAHGFDEYISEYMVSLNRSLPDRRDDWCKDPSNIMISAKDLPPTSVIVIFHNEAWSTLIRNTVVKNE